MTLITISRKHKILVTAFAILLTGLGYYLAVYKSFGYRSKNYIIGDVMILISLGIIEMMWLDMDRYANKNTFQVTVLTFIGIVTIMGTMMLKQNYLNSELNKNGFDTKATVVGFETDNSGRTTRNYAQIQYEYNSNQIIQREEYFDDKYKMNQNLKVRISKSDPYLYRIVQPDK